MSDITTEANTRASADTNLQQQINVHTTQIAQSCEIYLVTFRGDNSKDYSKIVTLGYRPKAVILSSNYGLSHYSAMSVDLAGQYNSPIRIIDGGFAVAYDNTASVNQSYVDYYGIILK